MDGGRRGRVLVTGGEHPGGLAALRALHQAGYEPWAVDTGSGGYAARSRASAGTVTVCDPRIDPLSFSGELAKAASRLGAVAVLPGTEAALLALGQYADLFPAGVAVGAPAPELTIAATDKESLAVRAARAGFAVPETRLVGLDDVAEVTFPAVAKPVRSELASSEGLRRFEVVRVDDAGELVAALHALPEQKALVQPYVSGPIRTVNGVAWNGEVVAVVHKLARRTWPMDCGVVCYATTVPVEPEVDRAARLLMADLGWSGLFNLQMIDSGGLHYVIDLNPRVYHSLALAVAAGANLPAVWVSLLLGETPPAQTYRHGVRFRSEEDACAIWGSYRAGATGAALRGLVPHPRTEHAIVSLRDPGPTMGLVHRASRVARRALLGSDG